MNTYTRCTFDMGHTSQVSYQMEAEDGRLDYIFIGGGRGDYKSLLSQYVQLTGAIPLIPKWAFGFWMSRCSYQTRQEIEEVVLRCEKEQGSDPCHSYRWLAEGWICRSMGMG